MGTRYNQIAGHSLERLAALSDGLFAVAMTLLILDLKVPVAELIHGEVALQQALLALLPRLLVSLMSFLTLGIFWVGQQTQLNQLEQVDRDLSWIHLVFLFVVTVMPLSTSLMAEFVTYRTALVVYWANILLLGLVLYVAWGYARRAGLVKADTPAEISHWVERRIVIAQVLYAAGAALCVINTYWSLGFIVLVQLNYVIAPKIGFLRRL